MDVVAQLTGDGVLSAHSRYLERLHGNESHHRRYRREFALFNDPTVAPATMIGAGGLAPLDRLPPRAAAFGERAFNQVHIRSGRDADATFVSFRAGGSFSHHGHYDAGHFTLFKGAPRAINSSLYEGFFSENRLNYSIRTVAKNALPIPRPGDTARAKLREGSARAVVLFTDERGGGEIAFAAPGSQRRVHVIGARPNTRIALAASEIRREVTVTGYQPAVFDVELTPGAVVGLRLVGAGEG